MQMHEGITGHTQIVYAFCGVVKSKLHPLSAVSLGMGQGGFTIGLCYASMPFNLLSTIAAFAKFTMSGPSLEVSLLDDSSLLLMLQD